MQLNVVLFVLLLQFLITDKIYSSPLQTRSKGKFYSCCCTFHEYSLLGFCLIVENKAIDKTLICPANGSFRRMRPFKKVTPPPSERSRGLFASPYREDSPLSMVFGVFSFGERPPPRNDFRPELSRGGGGERVART